MFVIHICDLKVEHTMFIQVFFTSNRWKDLIQEFHTYPFPDTLNNGSQLFISLLKVAW